MNEFWNLDPIYSGFEDPQFALDLTALKEKVAEAAGLKAPQKWNSAIGELKQGIIYAQGNVSVAAICGYLSWALR